ncbi:MAG: protease HtpX [Gammaproteobacteria bacterium]|jgi:heat shock protein HtpX|nr:protease HtpX [Gammaproteobacteria bacterium]
MFKRIALFLVTNLAVIMVLGVVLNLLGVDSLLDEQGRGMNIQAMLVFSAVLGFVGSFVSLAMSKWSAKRMTGAQVIETPRNEIESWLLSTVSRMAKTANIGTPEVAIYDSPEPNAFATGMNKNKALVAVSTGLLRNMQRNEVEAVVGHEIAHVANGDMVTLALIQGVVNTFVIFLSRVIGHIVDRTVFKTERGYGPGYFIVSMIAQLALGILASMVVAWFSRRREFRADQGGAYLSSRENMIGALQRLGQSNLPDQVEAMGIAGKEKRGITHLFMTHPPLSARIEALRSSGQAQTGAGI